MVNLGEVVARNELERSLNGRDGFRGITMRLTQLTICACLLLCSTTAAKAESPQANVAPRQGCEPSPAVVNPALRSPFRETVRLNGMWDFCRIPNSKANQPVGTCRAKCCRQPVCFRCLAVGRRKVSVSRDSHANNKLVYEPTNVKLRAAYTGAGWLRGTWRFLRLGLASRWLKLGGVNAQGWIWVTARFRT